MNNTCVVKIPSEANRDERIGSVFNYLFNVIWETENAREDTIIWDFSNSLFFHPFFLVPLSIYKNRCGKNIELDNMSMVTKSYFRYMCFENTLLIGKDTNLNEVLSGYVGKTYIPICKFALENRKEDELQSAAQELIERQSGADSKIRTPLSYFLSELICNIREHSKSPYGYIHAQYLRKEQCIDVSIADDGITVFGSYKGSGKYFDEINGNEAKALKLANDGYSTKDLPEAENRGYGISSTKKMLVDGLGGSFFMLSGRAFHRHDLNGSKFVNLPPNINWNGTIILMRIPITASEDFDYSKYVK